MRLAGGPGARMPAGVAPLQVWLCLGSRQPDILSLERTSDSLLRLRRTKFEKPGDRKRSMPDQMVIYPGSFDPITNGHLDLIERGVRMFGGLVVAVLTNIEKKPFFTVHERVDMLREVTREMPNVSVDTFSGLLVEYAKKKKARAILRGIRAFSDY